MKKKRKWERLLASILAVVLIFDSLPASSLAAGKGLTVGIVSQNKETEMQTEVQTGDETESLTEAESGIEPVTEAESGAEPAAESESGTEPATETEIGTEPATESESGTEPAAETEIGIEPVTEAVTEPAAEAMAEETEEAESAAETILEEQGISEAAVFEVPTEDGKVVKLSAPEGAFTVPASEVTMTVDPLTEEQKAALEEQLQALAEEDGMKVTGYVAYDINLWVNGAIVEPRLPVQVTFENIAVTETVEDEEDVPEDMSQVETAGFQMDTATNEITDVNDTTVADDATPEDASVAVEVEHFTITGSVFSQVDPTNPNNYVFTLEQSGDGTQEDGETEEGEESSGEVLTFEVNVESLKGIGEGELTLVPSIVDGTEEAEEGGTQEGEAEGTPVNVTFQSGGEEVSEMTNPTALGAKESWTQRIQIPVSELEGVKNPMLNIALMNGENTIATINQLFSTIGNYVAKLPTMQSDSSTYTASKESFTHNKTIDYLGDNGNNPDTTLDDAGKTSKDIDELYRLYLDITGDADPMDLLLVIDESSSMGSKTDTIKKDGVSMRRIDAVEKILNGENGKQGLINTFLNANEQNRLAVIGFGGGEYVYRYHENKGYEVHYEDSVELNSFKRAFGDWETYNINTDAQIKTGWTRSYTYQPKEYHYTKNDKGQLVPDVISTNYAAALYQASNVLAELKNEDVKRKHVMIFLSDGNPTCYLKADSRFKSGYSRYGNNADCLKDDYCVPESVRESVKVANEFKDNFPGLTAYSIAICNLNGDEAKNGKQALNALAFHGGTSKQFTTADQVMNQMWQIVFPTSVKIQDTLSAYVDYYGTQPDVKVTMKNNKTGKETVLWKDKAATSEGKDVDGKPIVASVTQNGKVITATFKDDYALRKDCTYTLSFNVKLSEYAKEEFKKNGYNATGQDSTDYVGNNTSSGKPGFYSNDNSVANTYVEYVNPNDGQKKKEEYQKPVVQTKTQTKTSEEANKPKGVGDVIPYTIWWNNSEPTAADVTITDMLDSGVDFIEDSLTSVGGGTGGYSKDEHMISWTVKDAAPGATGNLSFKVKVNENAIKADTDSDKVTNTAEVQVEDNPVVKIDPIENPVPKKQEVTPGDRKSVAVGQEITYEIFWENTYDEARTVTITDKLDEGLDFVSAEKGGKYDNASHTVTWDLGKQLANTNGSVKFVARVNKKALNNDNKVENQAGVMVEGSSEVKTNKVENPVPEKRETSPGADLMVKVGDQIDYAIDWQNGYDEAKTVTITDKLDPNVEYVPGSAEKTGGDYDAKERTITWEINANANQTGTVTFSVIVLEGAAKFGTEESGRVENSADVTVGNDAAVHVGPVKNPVPRKEEVTPGNKVGVAISKEITYRVYWRNTYDESATVKVTDTLDPGLDFVEDSAISSVEIKGTYDTSSRTITWDLGSRPANTEGWVEFKATVNKDAITIDRPEDEAGGPEVFNRAQVFVNDNSAWTNEVENPVSKPEKKETQVTLPDESTQELKDGGLVQVGDTIHFEIKWKNYHDTAATVEVKDTLTEDLDFVAAQNGGSYDERSRTINWDLGGQAAGAEGIVSFDAKVNENAKADLMVDNTAYVNVNDDGWVETNPVDNPLPEKKETAPGEHQGVKPGEQITYEITWQNGYDVPATVTITDKLDPGVKFVSADNGGKEAGGTVTWTISAEANAKGTVTLTVEITKAAYEKHEVDNQAFVQVGDDPAVRTDKVENPVPEKKEETPGADHLAGVGDTITYEIYWANTHDDARTVMIEDTLDPNVECVEESISDGGSYKDGTITWEFTADANSTGKVTFQVTVLASAAKYGESDKYGKVTNSADVTVQNDNTVTVGPVENPVPKKEESTPGNGKGVKPGEQITYDIYWENSNDSEAEVTITDDLDVGVKFVEAVGEHKDNAAYNQPNHKLTWTFKADKNTKGKVSFTVEVLESAVDYGVNGGDGKVVNDAVVQVGNSSAVTNKVENPTTEPHKTEVTPGDRHGVQVGDTIEYKVDYENYKDAEATVTITDKLDPGLNFVSASDGGVYDAESRVITWTLEKVPARGAEGSKGSVTFKATVNEAALNYGQTGAADGIFVPGDGKVLNQAEVQVEDDPAIKTEIVENPVTEPDKNATAVESGAGNHVDGQPAAGADGTYNDAVVQVGDTITYTIDWENYEETTATVTITDELDDGLTYVENSATNGGVCTYNTATKKYTITWTLENVPARGQEGSKGIVSFKATVNENARPAGEVVNDASVQVGDHPALSTKLVENPVPEKTETTPGENLGVYPGDEITYEISWMNTHDEAAEVTITDELDPGVEYIEAIGEHAADARLTVASSLNSGTGVTDQNRQTVTWTFTADANTKGTVSFRVRVLESAVGYVPGSEDPNEDGKVVNQAQVQVGNSSAYTSKVENPTTNPHKTETKPGDKEGVKVGDQIDYMVTYENYKNAEATVTIKDRLDPGLDYVEGSASDGGVYDAATRTITWTLEKVPARGEDDCTGFVTFSATVNEGALDYGESGDADGIFVPGDGKVLNQAAVKVDNDPEIQTEIVENPVTEPEKDATEITPADGSGDVQVEQTAGTYNDAVVQVGDKITYTIKWENYEETEATVTITDTLEAGLDYVEASAKYGRNLAVEGRFTLGATEGEGVYDAATRTITWTISNVPARGQAGNTGYATFQATVNESAEPAGKVTNDASVQVGNHGVLKTKPVENPIPEKTEVTPGENLGVRPGDVITYEVSWENTYDESADVTVTDVLDLGVEYVEDTAKFSYGLAAETAEGVQPDKYTTGIEGDGVYDAETHTITWTIPGAPANTKGKVTFKVRVLEDAVDYADGGDGKVVNQAKVQVGNNSRYTNEVENPTTEPHKMENAPGNKNGVQVGDKITYTVTFENYKNEPATVVITDKLDPGLDYVRGTAISTPVNAEGNCVEGVYDERTHTLTWTIENMPKRGDAYSTGTVTFEATVNRRAVEDADDPADGIFRPGDSKVLNQANVKVGTDPEVKTEIVENPVSEPEKDATAVTPKPGSGDVDVVQDANGTFNDAVVQVGDTITYTIKWKNYETDDDGNPVEATVTITDKLEDGLDYVEDSAASSTGEKGTYNKDSRTITWTLSAGPNAEGTVTFQATVNKNARPEGKITNSAKVKVGNHPALTTDSVENPIPEKTETDPGEGVGVYPGSEITYEVSWENTYDEPVDVTVTDVLDPGVEYVEDTAEFSYGLAAETAEGVQPGKYTAGVRGVGIYNAETRTITWTIPGVPANTKGKVTFKVKVLESAVDYAEGGDGKVVNRAKVQVGNNSRYTNEVENPTTEPHKMENAPGDGHGVRVGDEIMYTVLYENYRSETADVIITDELDPGLDYVEGSAQATAAGAKVSYENHTLTWTIPNVPARGEDNSTGFVSFRATVNQRAVYDTDDEDNGLFAPGDKKVLNQAEVQVGHDPKVKTEIVENPVTDPKKHATAVEPKQGNHEVVLQPNADGTFDDVVVQAGDVITYTIEWENYESTMATVTVKDKLENGLTYVPNSATSAGSYDEATRTITWTLPNIPARGEEGSTGTVSFKATVNEIADETGKVENNASVKVGNHPAVSTEPVENPVPEKMEVTPGEHLGVYPGDEITYEISWANTHDEPAEVVITDELDPGVRYLEAIGEHKDDATLTTGASLNSSTEATDQNRQTVIWTFTADPNTSGKVSFKVVVLESAVGYEPGSEEPDKDGKVVNQAKVQVGNSSAYTSKVENPTTNPHKTETAPGDKEGVKVGDQIDYMVTYENYKDTEATVTITDKLDPGLDYVNGSASNGGVYDAATRTITWTLTNVPARGTEGCTGYVTFSATVNEKALDYGQTGAANGIFVPGDGKVLNQAAVKVDNDPEIQTEIVENPVTEPEKTAAAVTPAAGSGDDIAVEPNADGTFNDTVAQVGDTITYTINWENYEETEAAVTITDTLEAGLTYVEGSASDGGVYDAATRTVTWTLTGVPARGQAGSAGSVTFQATVNENAELANKVTNDASVKVGNHGELKTEPVENPVPEKTEVTPGENLGVRPGDEITYEVSWENTYDEPADVIVTDVLDPGVEYVEGTATGSYKVRTNGFLSTTICSGSCEEDSETGRQVLTWTISDVPANTKGTVTFKVRVLESAVDYGTEGGDGKVVNRAKVQVGNSSRYTNEVENPTTEPHKTEVTPGDKAGVRVGDTIEYEVTYENYRNEPANVTITDELDPGLTYVDGSASDGGVYDAATRTITWTIPNVPARGEEGSTGSVTFKATVNELALDTGAAGDADGIFVPGDEKVLNQAEVQVGNDPKIKTEIVENPVTEPKKEATAVTPANTEVEVKPNADGTYNDVVVQVGDTITYTIGWENYEETEATVTITDTLEAGLTYVDGSAGDNSAYDAETHTITWTLTNVPAGSAGAVTFQAAVNENARPAGKVTNDAGVQVGNHPALSTKPVENPVPEKTETDPGAGLGVYPGREITYYVSWENTYDEEAAVTITDVLDPGVEFVQAIDSAEEGFEAEHAADASYNAETHTVTWTFTADGNTKGKVAFIVRVLESAVDYGTEGGDGKVVNRAKVQVGNSSTYTNEIENPTTEPHKTEVTPGDKAGVRVGDTIEYQVDYENYKDAAATVTITDRLDPGLTYVDGSASDGGVYDAENHIITWTLENVPARGETGSTGHVTFQATVNERALDYGATGDADGIFVPGDGKVVNQASVRVDTDPAIDTEIVENPVTEPKKDATAVEPAEGNHAVELQPNADGTYNNVVVQVGDTIEYTIKWENYEETTAAVTITDTLEADLTYVPNSATSGGRYDEATRTITWTLPNIPARGLEGSTGTVSFRAVVNADAAPDGEVVNDADVQVGNHPALSTKPVENPVPEKAEVTPGEHLGVYPGDEITYEISWANTHDEPAEVVITDVLDPGVKFLEAIGEHSDAEFVTVVPDTNVDGTTPQTVTWTFMADGSTEGTVSFRVEVLESAVGYEPGSEEPDKDGKVVNQAQVQVGNNSAYTSKVENPTTNPHKTETAPGDKEGVKVGDQIDYMVTYENYKDTEAKVTITDRLDPGLDYVDGSASNGGVYDEDSRTITWTLENVPARGTEGCTGFVTFSATVNEEALDYGETGDADGIFVPGDGKVVNQASVQVDTDPAVDTEIVENPVTEPEKTATAVTPAAGSGDDIAVEPNADGTFNDTVAQVGDTITYTIKWENYEETEAIVTITDTLEAGLTYVDGSADNGGVYDAATRTVTWTLTNVPARGEAGSTGSVTFQAAVNGNAVPNGEVANDASVKVGNHGAVTTKPVENPLPEKTERTPGEDLGVRPGDEIIYDITWENTYDVESTVTVTDELDPGVEFVQAIGEHAGDAVVSSEEGIYTVTWTFQAEANTDGAVSFKVRVLESAVDYEDGGDGKVANRAKVQVGNSSRYTNEVENPTTEPHKTEVTPGDKAGVRVGDTIEYRVTYENYRNEPADVTITDELDPGLDYVAGSAGNGVYDPETRVITWTILNVPARGEAGSTGTVTFKATVNQKALDDAADTAHGIFAPNDQKVLNQAEVQVGNDPKIRTEIVENPVTEPEKTVTAVTPANTEAEVKPNADGTYNDVVVQVGDTITYTIRWENYETDDEGNPVNADVTITDELEAGLTYVDGSASDGGVYDEDSRTITWTLKNAPAGEGTVTFQAAVNENAREAGKVANDAGVQVGNYPVLSTKPVENPVPEKTESAPGADLGVYPGEEITYDITWENTYDVESTVTVTDELDPGVEFVEAIGENAADASYNAETHTVTWTFTAAAGGKGTVSFTVTVLESAVDYGTEGGDGKVVNRAKVQVGNSSTYTNEIENPTTEPHKTEVTPGDKAGVLVGDTIEYQVDYENYEDAEATVTITDELDPGLTYVDGSASDGGVYDEDSRTITWTLENVPARGSEGSTGSVTFEAVVNERALDYGETGSADGIFVPGDGKVVNQAAVQVGDNPAIRTEIVENPVTEPEKDATAVEPAEGNHAVELQPNEDGTYNDVVVQVGDVITYTIRWENYEDTAADVTITDTLETGLDYVPNSAVSAGTYDEETRTVTWSFRAPARGQEGSSGTVSFKAQVNESARTAGIENDASVQVGNHPALSTKPVENPVPEKAEVTPGENLGVYPGDEITYEISWANTHDEPAEVVITDVLDPGVKFLEAIGEHSDAETVTVVPDTNEDGTTPQTVTWTFMADGGTEGTVSFRVVVLESAAGYEPGSEDPNADGKVVNQAQVQVGNSSAYTNKVENPTTNPHKTETAPGDKEGVKVGDQIGYMVTYENYQDAAADVVVTDTLDPGLDYVDGSASDGGVYDAETRTITWTFRNVPARGTEGSTGYVTFSAAVNELALDYGAAGDADGIFVPGDGKVVNQAVVQVGDDPEIRTEIVENPVTEPEKAAAAVTPAEGSGDDITAEPNADGTFDDVVVQVGDVITYRISWENYEETEATVIVTDQLEDGLTYVAGSAEAGGVYDEAARTITWTLTHIPGRGNAGSAGTVTFQAVVNENAEPAGKVVNDASVKVGNHGALKTEPVENPVPEKTERTPGADLGVYPGEEITYDITWENTYEVPSTVTVTDVLDPGVEFAEAIDEHAADASYNAETHNVTWTFAAEADTSGKVSFTVRVLESAVDYGTEGGDGKVVNRAKVQVGNSSRYTNEVENPTTSPQKTEPNPGADLPVEVGDVITYNVFWENYTDETADIVITDHLDEGLTYVAESVSRGGVYDAAARTLIWTLEDVPARGSEGSSGYVSFQAEVNEIARVADVVENQAGVKVGNNPEILTNVVENPTEPVVITKIDAETGEALAGAVLRIVDANGTSIEEWTTDGTPHTVRAKLTAGAVYTLVEVSAPSYYSVAPSAEFTVGENGRVAPITMEDRRISSADAAIRVTKTLLYDGSPVNAVDETFHVALFSDAERTTRVSDVKALEFKNASAATVEFRGLEIGKTYYIGETDPNGVMIEAGQLADGTLYRADFSEGYDATVREENGTVTRNFSNYLEQIPDNQFYREGTLTVTKQLMDENGAAIEGQNQTFYAGIFADAEHTVLSDKVEQNILPLTLNGTSSTSAETAVSITPGETLTLYVTEVDETGTPVSTDTGFEYTLILDKVNVTITEENPDGHVTMTNRPYLPQDFYKSGELTITKQLLGADGTSKPSDETFYAGIFADEACTELAGNVSANVVALPLGGNASVTETVEVSFGTEESVTLYVTEVTVDGTPVENAASFKYDVTIEGSTVTLSNEEPEASVVITNKETGETEPDDEIETESNDRTPTRETEPTISQTSVKTGDETPVLLYLGIFAAAAVILLILLFGRRRRSSK